MGEALSWCLVRRERQKVRVGEGPSSEGEGVEGVCWGRGHPVKGVCVGGGAVQ